LIGGGIGFTCVSLGLKLSGTRAVMMSELKCAAPRDGCEQQRRKHAWR